MPQIIVTADRGDGTVTWRERINASDFESQHFARQLVERIGWAVGDAHALEQDPEHQLLSAETPKPTSARKRAPVAAT